MHKPTTFSLVLFFLCSNSVFAQTVNYSLRFYGNAINDIDRVKIQIDTVAKNPPGPPADVGSEDFTLEFWMKASAAENLAGAVNCGNNINWINGNIIIDRDRFNEDCKFGLSVAGGAIVFGVSGSWHRRPHDLRYIEPPGRAMAPYFCTAASRRRLDVALC